MCYYILLFSIFISSLTYGQGKVTYVYDLSDRSLDSLLPLTLDPAITSERTPFYKGSINSLTEVLSQTPPVSNLFPGSQFTVKRRVANDFDASKFPIRTSVKIIQEFQGSIGSLCSGSLISKRHILTAAHCICELNKNELRNFDSLFVAPVFDNGNYNPSFNASGVVQVYFFKDWRIGNDDIAILELADAIGESTGYISIGFNTADSLLRDSLYYKFSYPGFSNIAPNPNHYNGDTLYYNYGVVDGVRLNSMSISNTSGAPGESGSSLIRVVNDQEYTSYAVLSNALNLNHNRITNWKYYMLKQIIQSELLNLRPSSSIANPISVYPNPAHQFIYFRGLSAEDVVQLQLYDETGRLQQLQTNFEPESAWDVSALARGVYYLHIYVNGGLGVVRKIVLSSF